MSARWIYAAVLPLLLAACGGGGDSAPQSGSGATPPPATNPPPSSGSNPDPGTAPNTPPSSGTGNEDGGSGTDDGSGTPPPTSGGGNSGSGGSGSNDGGNTGNNDSGSTTPPAGPLTNVSFDHPKEIEADASGNLYVVDRTGSGERIRRIAPNGSVTTIRAEAGQDITALAVTPDGNIVYATADPWNGYDPIDRRGALWRLVNGAPVPVTLAELGMVEEMVIDPRNGDIYLPDRGEMKRVSQDGSVTSLFSLSTGAVGGMALRNGVLWMHLNYIGRDGSIARWIEGGPLERLIGARLGRGMVATDAGIYLTSADYDRGNQHWVSCRVNFFDTETLALSEVAGTPGSERCSYPDELGQNAGLEYSKITQGSDDNLYVTGVNLIRRVTPAGEVSVFAGSSAQ